MLEKPTSIRIDISELLFYHRTHIFIKILGNYSITNEENQFESMQINYIGFMLIV